MSPDNPERQRKHSYYEECCALAAAECLSERELADLVEHLETCDQCWNKLEGFLRVIAILRLHPAYQKRQQRNNIFQETE